MRPPQIQLSMAMLCMLASVSLILPLRSGAQSCTGTLQSTTYTAVFSGTGNDVYTPVFPQYSPPGGYLLLSATLKSVTSVNATLQLNNSGSTQATFKPGVIIEHNLQLNGSDILDNDGDVISDITANKNFAQVTMNPGDAMTVGPSPAFTNKTIVNIPLTTADGLLNSFVGTGNLDLTYTTSTSYITSVSINPSVTDVTTFTLTYQYCYGGTLAADILSFTAVRENEQTIALNWLTANEQAGRKYIIQVSSGAGAGFADLATQPADPVNRDAGYSYRYLVRPADKGRLYFRLKLVDVDGTAGYSAMRIVDLGNNLAGAGFSIFPNPPVDDLHLQFPLTAKIWQVDILAADGRLVQRNYFNNADKGQLIFNHKLAAGTYFCRATEVETAKNYSAAFVIR
ncbi:T9SS type A sorting domain-containing protein [Flavitalea flava]